MELDNLGKNSIRQYENTIRIVSEAIELLDNIWYHNMDVKFNDTICILSDQLFLISDQFKTNYDKLMTYKIIFSINIQRDIKNGKIHHMMHSHIVDSWRLLLLQINYDVQKLINTYYKNKTKFLGMYIQNLQGTLANKNNFIKEHKNVINILGNIIKDDKNKIHKIEHDYELIAHSKPQKIFGYWF